MFTMKNKLQRHLSCAFSFKRFFLLSSVLLLTLSLFTSCRSIPLCQGTPPPLSAHELAQVWKLIQHKAAEQREVGPLVNRFLQDLLANGSYQLEATEGSFRLVRAQEASPYRCQARHLEKQLVFLGGEAFLKKLHKLVTTRRVRLYERLVYTPPVETISAGATQLSGGHCADPRFSTTQKIFLGCYKTFHDYGKLREMIQRLKARHPNRSYAHLQPGAAEKKLLCQTMRSLRQWSPCLSPGVKEKLAFLAQQQPCR